MGRLVVCDHPLIQHKLTIIRDKTTNHKQFRELVDETATLIGIEATRDLPLEPKTVETPVGRAEGKTIAGRKIGLIPILRAGLGMVEGLLRLLPSAKVGHIGLYRDPETLKPVQYYISLPSDAEDRDLIVIDPMLATGGSAIAAISMLKERNCRPTKMLCLIASPERGPGPERSASGCGHLHRRRRRTPGRTRIHRARARRRGRPPVRHGVTKGRRN